MSSPARFDNNKVTIIGCGRVGMSVAFSLLHDNLVNELVLLGRHKQQIVGEQLDLEHGLSFLNPTKILATDSYLDIRHSDVVVITAGSAQKPGDTRLDLAQNNLAVIEQIIPMVVRHAPGAVVIIVSNPVDVLTYRAYQLAGWPKGRIFGSGTTLDTARFRFHLSQFLQVSPNSIHAYILGEHGDSSFPVLSSATVGGQTLNEFPEFSDEKAQTAFQKAKNAAYKIIESKGSTYYGIAAVIHHLVKTVLTNAKEVLPVSIPLHQYLDHSGVSLSVPCVVDRSGVGEILKPKLNWEEKQALARSVEKIKQYCQ
ncbi:L-lactate dehydrogenase [Patescibacteria group bacterium]|nr:L-lactate dehydrogenase [Patescibacteria group bacterium]